MGLLIEGRWTDRWYDTEGSGGRFVRRGAQFRDTDSANPTRVVPLGPADFDLTAPHGRS